MSALLLIGGGGHCLSVIDALGDEVCAGAGIIDLAETVGKKVMSVPVVGTDDDLVALRNRYDEAFVSLGSIGDWKKRSRLHDMARDAGYEIPVIIHPAAIVSGSAQIGAGVFIGAGAVVNAQALIGENSILNTSCVVEHSCTVGKFVHVAPGAVLCGNVSVGQGSHIGANCTVKQGVSIGANCIIGIGSVVTKDIPDNAIAYGNPCCVVRMRS